MNNAEAANTSIAAKGPNRTAAKIAGSSEIETLTSLRSVTWPRSPYVATMREADDRKRTLKPVAVGEEQRRSGPCDRMKSQR